VSSYPKWPKSEKSARRHRTGSRITAGPSMHWPESKLRATCQDGLYQAGFHPPVKEQAAERLGPAAVSTATAWTTSGASEESACGDESETHALRSENARLREQLLRSDAEVARLRQQLQRLQESHAALPDDVPAWTARTAPTVDLSRIDTSLVAHIVSFLGTSLELRNLALTCRAFGWQQPATGPDLSLAEEVARQVVRSGKNDVEGVRITLSPYVRSTTTWLSILRESEDPLKFDTLCL
ncbi:hypothetical protein THAOC_33224, partial [Thalassiosira oceanica]